MKKVYISGPVTGLDLEDAKKRFAFFEDKIKSIGHEAVNPINNGLTEDDPWIDHMVIDLKMLYYCDEVIMLKDWEFSKGACLEHEMAKLLGMTIYYEENIDIDNFSI